MTTFVALPETQAAEQAEQLAQTPRATRRRVGRLEGPRRFALDVGVVLVAVVLTAPSDLPGLTAAASVLVVLAIALAGQYDRDVLPARGVRLRMAASVVALGGFGHALLASLSTGDAAAADAVTFWAVAGGLLLAGRVLEGAVEVAGRRRGLGQRRTLIVGAGEVGHRAARRLAAAPDAGLVPIGFLDHDPFRTDGHVPVLGGDDRLEDIVREHDVDAVVIGFSTLPHTTMLSLVHRCWDLGLEVHVVPRLFEVEGKRTRVAHLGGLPVVRLTRAPLSGSWLRVKYAIDRVVAAVLLVLLAPLMALIAISTLVTDGGPVLFRGRRVGAGGTTFTMLKFRTMRGRPEVRGEADADWAAAADLGIEEGFGPSPSRTRGLYTPLGWFLRRVSLDELPQLWCVLRGEMSLVGPRPERVEQVRRFEQSVYRYADRHRVRPGITGWAQVHGLRGRTSLADRVEWDLHYVESWSLWLDVRIVSRTFAAILRGAGD